MIWRLLDTLAHWLGWRWLVRLVCDRYERALGVPTDEFDELNMTDAEFDARAAAGEPVEVVVPIGWACDHLNITSVPGPLRDVRGWCGCEMQPVFASTAVGRVTFTPDEA